MLVLNKFWDHLLTKCHTLSQHGKSDKFKVWQLKLNQSRKQLRKCILMHLNLSGKCHAKQRCWCWLKHIHNLTNHLRNLDLSFQDVCERVPILQSDPSARFPLPEQIVLKWWVWQCCIFHCIIYIHIRFILNSETESNTWRKTYFKKNQGIWWRIEPAIECISRSIYQHFIYWDVMNIY